MLADAFAPARHKPEIDLATPVATHPSDSTASVRIRVIDGAFWEGRVQPNGSNALSKMFGSWVVMGCMRRGGRAGAGVQVHQLLTAAFGDSLTSRL